MSIFLLFLFSLTFCSFQPARCDKVFQNVSSHYVTNKESLSFFFYFSDQRPCLFRLHHYFYECPSLPVIPLRGGGGRIVELPKEKIAKIYNKFYKGLEWDRRHAISNLSTFLNPRGKHYRGAAIINVASL